MIEIIPHVFLFFYISIFILLITFLLLIGVRFFFKEWIRYIPIFGIYIAGIFAFFPLLQKNELLSQIIDALTKSGQMFVLDLDYGTISVGIMQFPTNIIIPYQILLAILNLLAPICTTVIILSFISDLLSYWKIGLYSHRDRHIFSQLNEKSLLLAKSMNNVKNEPRYVISLFKDILCFFTRRDNSNGISRNHGLYIFCGLNRSDREENPYYEEAKKMGFIIVDRHIGNIRPAKKKKSNYFLISKNGSENTSLGLYLMEKFKGEKNVKIFVMSNESETEYLLDKKIKEHGLEVVNLHHINEVRLISYDLLSKNPLYSVLIPGMEIISMLIIGSGYLGLEILKNSIWCSRNHKKYHFEATIVDKNIGNGMGMFQRACPDLDLNEYNIIFHQSIVDADTNDIINLIEKKSGRYNYVVIVTDSDDSNIKVALDIRSWYMRKKMPVNISLAIRDNQKFDLIQELKDETPSSVSITIFPFACISQMYKRETILENPMEHMGVCINAIYSNTYNKYAGNNVQIDYNTALADWRILPLQKKRSSMALALFIRYVLWMKGYLLSNISESEILQFSENEIEEYAKIEHERWNAYMLIEGFYRWPYDDFMKQENQQRRLRGENVDVKAGLEIDRLHACITTWELILEMDQKLMMCYADYDREFIRNIPNIVSGFSNTFNYHYGIITNNSYSGKLESIIKDN